MKVNRIKYYIFIVCFYVLLFQNALQDFIPFLKYVDELVSYSFFPVMLYLVIFKREKIKFKRNDFIILILIFLFFIVGVLSSAYNMYQPTIVAVKDATVVFKFFFAYFSSKLLFDTSFLDEYRDKLRAHTEFLIYSFFVLSVNNYLFGIWKSDSYRMGIMSNRLFYSHETNLVASCVFLLSVSYLVKNNGENVRVRDILISIVALSSLRAKGMGAVAIILLVIIYIKKLKRKIPFIELAVFGLIGVVLAWKQIKLYYIGNGESARRALTEICILIANDHFPLGAGFATFGSYFSGVYYSPLYYHYGISTVYGLRKNESMFMSDTFWPMIIGQFGYIGLALYIGIIALLFLDIQKQYDGDNDNLYISKIIVLVYLLISSTSESAFVNPFAIPLAIVLGINTALSNNN